ncbi:MAG: hypothetical protein Q7T97_13440 [Burkholderiaceae bacterium]|nr:hypothetical protein [Burkholderiaceae bacterium]
MTQPECAPEVMTIDEEIAQLRREERERYEAGLKIMKAIHAAGPTLKIPRAVLANRRARRKAGPGTIVKVTECGEFLGYWREGQTRGRPSSLMPLEQEYLDATERYFKMLRDSVPRAHTNAILSQRSVAARQTDDLAPALCARYDALTELGVPRSERVNRIAKAFDRTADHVRRVLRTHGYRLGPTRQK